MTPFIRYLLVRGVSPQTTLLSYTNLSAPPLRAAVNSMRCLGRNSPVERVGGGPMASRGWIVLVFHAPRDRKGPQGTLLCPPLKTSIDSPGET
jgi:hypothetical protein